jgi:hypothetical protein
MKYVDYVVLFMIFFVAAILLFYSLHVEAAKPFRVAVIDTGKPQYTKSKLCVNGHKDFTNTTINDVHGHATNIAGLIHDEANNSNYCLIFLKYYLRDTTYNMRNSILALRRALELNVNMIVYAGGGPLASRIEKEYVMQLLEQNVLIVAAAGNNKANLLLQPYYPASYDKRIIVVGCTDFKGSNYGKIVDVRHNCIKKGQPLMTGTSQATAIQAGKLIHFLTNQGGNNNEVSR